MSALVLRSVFPVDTLDGGKRVDGFVEVLQRVMNARVTHVVDSLFCVDHRDSECVLRASAWLRHSRTLSAGATT